jgi:hypothetical protein
MAETLARKLLGIYGRNFGPKIIGNLWLKLWPENYQEFMPETLP